MVASFTRHVDADLSRVTREELDEWLSSDRGRKPATLTQRRVCARPFIRWLAKNGYIAENFVGEQWHRKRPGEGRTKPGTLAPWAAAYLKQGRKQGRLTHGTMLHKSYALSSLDESFGDRRMETFGARAIERWLEQNSHWKPSTR